jgi:hypothetical protein
MHLYFHARASGRAPPSADADVASVGAEPLRP